MTKDFIMNWTPPSTGDQPFTNYRVEYAVSGQAVSYVNTGSGDPAYRLSGLTEYEIYQTRVAAINVAGTGEYSDLLYTYASQYPSQPLNLATVTSSVSGEIRLTWSTPEFDGGTDISDYNVIYTPDGESTVSTTVGSTATFKNLTSLDSSKDHYVIVNAINTSGSGVIASGTFVPFSPEEGVPSAPTNLDTQSPVNSGDINLIWDVPADDGGAPITDYNIIYTPDGESTVSTTSGSASNVKSLSGLDCSKEHYILVNAVNSVGFGPSVSGTFTPYCGQQPPSEPLGLSSGSPVSSGDLNLTWSAPTDDGSGPITDYNVIYTPDGESTVNTTVGSTDTFKDLSGLDCSKDHYVLVNAINSVGSGIPVSGTFTPYCGEEEPPTGDTDEYFDSVVLLTHFDGGDGSTSTTDNSNSAHTLTMTGAALTVDNKKFGTASLEQTTESSPWGRVTTPPSSDWAFGTGDFTIEGEIYISNYPSNSSVLAGAWNNVGQEWLLRIEASGFVKFYTSNDSVQGNTQVPLNQWNHIAVSRTGGEVKIFINGVQDGAKTIAVDITNSAELSLGNYSPFGNWAYDQFPDYVDEIRITKGVGRYTSNFTRPTEPHPNSGPETPPGDSITPVNDNKVRFYVPASASSITIQSMTSTGYFKITDGTNESVSGGGNYTGTAYHHMYNDSPATLSTLVAGDRVVELMPVDSNGDYDPTGFITGCSLSSNTQPVTAIDISYCANLLYAGFMSVDSSQPRKLYGTGQFSSQPNTITEIRAEGLILGTDPQNYYSHAKFTTINGWYWGGGGIDLSGQSLSAEALDQMYTDLLLDPSDSTLGTLIVAGNPGVSSDDPSIATAKGYTVEG
jgi:hypothetical protein